MYHYSRWNHVSFSQSIFPMDLMIELLLLLLLSVHLCTFIVCDDDSSRRMKRQLRWEEELSWSMRCQITKSKMVSQLKAIKGCSWSRTQIRTGCSKSGASAPSPMPLKPQARGQTNPSRKLKLKKGARLISISKTFRILTLWDLLLRSKCMWQSDPAKGSSSSSSAVIVSNYLYKYS